MIEIKCFNKNFFLHISDPFQYQCKVLIRNRYSVSVLLRGINFIEMRICYDNSSSQYQRKVLIQNRSFFTFNHDCTMEKCSRNSDVNTKKRKFCRPDSFRCTVGIMISRKPWTLKLVTQLLKMLFLYSHTQVFTYFL